MKKSLALFLVIAFALAYVPRWTVDHSPSKQKMSFIQHDAQLQMAQQQSGFQIIKLDVLNEETFTMPEFHGLPHCPAFASVEDIWRQTEELNKGPPTARSGTLS